MQVLGILMMIAGAFLAFAAYGTDTSIDSGFGQTVNLSLLQQQMMMLQTGLAVFLAGSVFTAAGGIFSRSRGVASREHRAEMVMEHERQPVSDSARLSGLAIFIGLGIAAIVVLFLLIANPGS